MIFDIYMNIKIIYTFVLIIIYYIHLYKLNITKINMPWFLSKKDKKDKHKKIYSTIIKITIVNYYELLKI
jgi:hypothetical protein